MASTSLRSPLVPGNSRISDLLLVGAVMFILAMMVLPMPAWLIDVLVAVNMASAVVLLLVALYLNSPLEFSVFPSVLLISTLFRLALSIATTRLILLHGEGGHIIETFGKVVAGGNLVVGLVVFLIITVVQFIVIAKGAERVAEVAARFTLDAMPGKQMSIDSDLRSGLLDKDEARRKRRELEDESKMHGNLDGAMKFVKGDAIAGIIIIAINLLGGLAIGVMQRGMDAGTAMMTYSVLTIGDGMVTQIPALLSAMAAGLIVTRSADEERDSDLGRAIGKQVAEKPRVLLVAGGLCVLLALVPGFPWLVFLLLGAVLGGAGALRTPALKARWVSWSRPARETVMRRKSKAPESLTTEVRSVPAAAPLSLDLPAGALTAEAAADLVRQLEGVLDHFGLRLGLPLPRIALAMHRTDDTVQPAATWRLLAWEVPIAQGALPEGDVPPQLAEAVRQALRRHAALFFGTQEASTLLTRLGQDMPDIVKEATRMLPLPRLAEVLRRLLEEEVAIRNMRDILESIAEAGQREKDPYALTELSRIALKRQLCHRVAPDGQLRAVLLTPDLEEMIRQAIHVSNGAQHLALDPATARQLTSGLVAAVNLYQPGAVLAAVDIRRHVRKLIEHECFETPVLSYHELMPTLQLEPVGRVSLPAVPMLEAA
jgi:type III secretion protein V